MNLIRDAGIIALAAFFLKSSAENICNETIPANRAIDGIPAYAQCSTSTSASIYSNNGTDTRTSSGGTGWMRTQWGGGYQCTEFAFRYLSFRWNIKSVPSGNAGTWGDDALPAGLTKVTSPVHGDLIIFAPGSCGAGATTGHVAVIDSIKDTILTIVEQNGASRRKCRASCAKCFIHAAANNGIVSSLTVRQDSPSLPPNLQIYPTKSRIALRLTGDFTSGASVRIYNLRGQLIADLTDKLIGGAVSFATPAGPSTSLVVSACKGNRIICRKIAMAR